MQLLSVISLLLLVSACGKSNSNAGLPLDDDKFLPIDGSNIEGLYMAKFSAVNPYVNGNIPGSATIQRQADKFHAYVRLYGGAPNALHQQNIYEGKRCPDAGDDLNGDGYIDIEEGNRVWGNILIPLDSNLKSQSAGGNVFPVSDSSGSYFYERSTSFGSMFQDLRTEDKNVSDNVVKLDPSRGFDIQGRVVVIQGTSSSIVLPETVASNGGRSAYQTIPVACGTFNQVTSVPTEPDIETPPPVEPPAPEVTPVPQPEPIPTPDVNPQPEPRPAPRDTNEDEDEDDDRWYDDIFDWWRDRWNRDRQGRGTIWGNR